MNFQSRLCDRINDLNLRIRYYANDILRGEKYYLSNKILYAFSPKKERIVVVHENDIYQYIYMSGSTIQIECSCKKGFVCEHTIGAILYLKDIIHKLDSECSAEDNSSSLMKLEPNEIINYIKKLVGNHYYLIDELSLDFTVVVDALIKKLINNTELYINETFKLLELLIKLLKNKNHKISIERNVIDLIDSIKDIKIEKLVNKVLKLIDNIDYKILIDILDNYWEMSLENKINDSINFLEKVLSYYLNNHNELKENQIDLYYSVLYDLRLSKTKSLFTSGKFDNFYNYALENIENEDIKLLLYKHLRDTEKYEEIISLWNENNNDNKELKEIYYVARTKCISSNSNVMEHFINFPTLENFMSYSQKGLLEINDEVLEVIDNNFTINEKCLIYIHIKDYEKLFDLCKSKGFDFALNYTKELYENVFEKFIKYYQEQIIEISKSKRVFKEIVPYLQKLNQFYFGKFYIYHLVDYLIEKECFQYYEKYQAIDYLKRMTL